LKLYLREEEEEEEEKPVIVMRVKNDFLMQIEDAMNRYG